MLDATAPTTWSFVYTRNKKADYAFIVLPEPFSQDIAATSSLIEAFSDGSGNIVARDITARGRNWTIFFEQNEAIAGAEHVFDHVGRPIIVIEGFIADRPMSVDAAAVIVADARKRLQSLLRLFWGLPAQGPILSGASSVAASAPPQVGVSSPVIGQKALSLQTPPNRSRATVKAEKSEPRRWREHLYLVVIGVLITGGSILIWNADAEKAKLEKQIQQLNKSLETPKKSRAILRSRTSMPQAEGLPEK